MNISAVQELVREKGIRYFMVSFVEMNGISRAKLVPAETLEALASGGVGFAGFAAGDLGQGPHDPDISAIPDFSSLFILPWRRDVAWLSANLYVNGKPWPYCPRTILQRMVKKARDRGYRFVVGMEPEFFLVRRVNGCIEPYDPMDNSDKPCYNSQALARNLDFFTRLVGYMNELNWGVYQCDHEDANCQFEINWQCSEVLEQCDRLTFARFMIRSLAEQEGLTATFMPKPFKNLTGNGCHYHMSLWDAAGSQNLFMEEKDPHGLSRTAYWFIGGILKHARSLAAITSPTVNSYKRLVTSPTTSGATWAPVYVTGDGSLSRFKSLREHRLFFGNPEQVVIQLVGVVASWAIAAAGTFIILQVIKLFCRLRAGDEEQETGLDLTQHGEDAYTDLVLGAVVFNTGGTSMVQKPIEKIQTNLAR